MRGDRGRDLLGLAVSGLGLGTAVGVGVQALATWGVRMLQAGAPAPATGGGGGGAPALGSPTALTLLLGTLAGVTAAAIMTWTVLAPLHNPWRQGMLGMVAAFGSFALSLLAIPLDHWLGRPGLLGFAVLAFGIAVLIGRRLPGPREAS